MGKEGDVTSQDKWRYTLYTAILLFLLFRPETFQLVQSLLGKSVDVASASGCPTSTGFAIHLVVFTLIIRMMMDK